MGRELNEKRTTELRQVQNDDNLEEYINRTNNDDDVNINMCGQCTVRTMGFSFRNLFILNSHSLPPQY